MSTSFSVRTRDLLPHLKQMQAVQREELQSDKALEIDNRQPLRQSIPCGFKVKSVKPGFSMEMKTVVCGKENLERGNTELCSACHAVFKDVASRDPQEARLNMEYMEMEEVEAEAQPSFVRRHPYLTAGLVGFAAICGLVAYSRLSNEAKADPEPGELSRMTGDFNNSTTVGSTTTTIPFS